MAQINGGTSYAHLDENDRKELVAQHRVNIGDTYTILDFAFPFLKIAIYCDGWEWHQDQDSFVHDRKQIIDLQLAGWIVLRFAGTQIYNDIYGVIRSIKEMIEYVRVREAFHYYHFGLQDFCFGKQQDADKMFYNSMCFSEEVLRSLATSVSDLNQLLQKNDVPSSHEIDNLVLEVQELLSAQAA